ncbi:MAG: MBL fold metallo-hydrolase [Pseudomonadota bacterium]
MDDKITLLGVKGGPSLRKGSSMPTASVLRMDGKTMLIDAGVGATRSAVEAGVELLDIDVIFITHLHSDHILDLGSLLYTAWTNGLRRVVPIYGPPGTQEFWNHFLRAMSFDHGIRMADEGRVDLADLVEFHEISDNWTTDIGGIRVAALRVDHPPVTDCFALRFDGSASSVCFSSDTCYFPPLGPFASGVDVLVHEAILIGGVEKVLQRTGGGDKMRAHLVGSHTEAVDVGRIATAAMVGTLVLHHMLPVDDPDFGDADWRNEVSKTWNGPLLIGKDGMEIPLKTAASKV